MSKAANRTSGPKPFKQQIAQLARSLQHLQLNSEDMPLLPEKDTINAQLATALSALSKVEQILARNAAGAGAAPRTKPEEAESPKHLQAAEVQTTIPPPLQGVFFAQHHSLQYISTSLLQLLGYTDPEELIDAPLYSILHPEFSLRFAQYQLQALHQSLEKIPGILLHKDGSAVEVLLDLMAVPFQEKPVILVVVQPPAVSQEHPEERLHQSLNLNEMLEASEKFNKLVISSVNEGVVVYDRTFRYKVWNTFMEKRFGLKASEVLNKRTDEVFPYVGKIGLIEVLERALQGEIVYVGDTYLPTSKTTGYWVTSSFSPLINSQSEIIGVVSTVSDVTERKKAEQAMKEQKQMLQSFFDTAPFSMCVFKLTEGDYIHKLPNKHMASFLGYPLEEFKGKTATELGVPQEKIAAWYNLFNTCLKTGKTLEKEVLYKHQNGKNYWLLSRFSPINGTTLSFIAIDITERKEAEEEKIRLLEKKQQLYRALEINRDKLKNARKITGIGSWEYDLIHGTGRWSDDDSELHELDPAGKTPDLEEYLEMLSPEHRPAFLNAWQEAISKGEGFDIVVKLQAQGAPHRWERSIGKPVFDDSGKVVKLVGVTYDLTDQKNAEEKIAELLRLSQEMNTRLLASEEALTQSLKHTLKLNKKIKQSEQRWQFALESSGSGVWDWDLVTNQAFFNDTLKELLGYKKEDSLTDASLWASRIFPEDKDRVMEVLNTYLSGKSEQYEVEYRVQQNDKAGICWVLVRGTVIERSSEGKPLRMIGTMVDITEQKQYQEILANAANYLDKIINTILDPIFVKDREHRLVLVNDACCALFQKPREELLGKNDYELLPEENAAIFQEGDEYVFTTGEDSVREEEFTKPNGKVRAIITKKSLYVDSSGKPFVVGTVMDFSDRKELEQRLKEQNENLIKINAELDSFVYRTSHDLRSPLASVLGLIGVSRLEQNEQERMLYLDLMEKSIRKLDSFIHDIINYAKNARVAVAREEVNLLLLVQEIFEGLKFMEGYDSIDKKIDIEQTAPFYSDLFRLRIIFNNLLSNAIKYRSTRVEQSFINVQIEVSQQKAVFQVIDNGKGISPENSGRIFEMFFRASTTSTGSGIGLYIVKEAVNTLGGSITVASVPGQGSTFTIELPNVAP